MKTALWPLQKALVQRWGNDKRLPNVYDHVPNNASKPYIAIGEPIVTPLETKTSYFEEIPFTHHIYSDYSGKKETYDIMNDMLKSLSSAPLQIEGVFYLQKYTVEQVNVITDIDNTTYHGILRIRYYIGGH